MYQTNKIPSCSKTQPSITQDLKREIHKLPQKHPRIALPTTIQKQQRKKELTLPKKLVPEKQQKPRENTTSDKYKKKGKAKQIP